MTKPTTIVAISIMTITLITAGLAGSQLANATTATLTNSQFGQADRSNVARTVAFTTAQIPAGEIITDVNIRVDFEKDGDDNCFRPDRGSSFSREISMSLRSPSGTLVNLVFDQTPGPPTYTSNADANRVLVTFDDSAATIVGGPLPVSGTFRPAQPLSAFNGESPLGTWTFVFGDDIRFDFLCFFRYDLTIVAVSPVTPVDIDIKPGSDPSTVNCKNNKGNVPVAVFGSNTFDATTIDPTSLELNLASVTEVHNKVHIEDVNNDGTPDAVLHLDKGEVCSTQKPNPLKESVDATLTGSNADGDFEGTGDIRPLNS